MLNFTFFGDVDLALIALYAFWIFFALLIVYLQRENMREGYPLEDEDGRKLPAQSVFSIPSAKMFRLPFDRGEVVKPGDDPARHDLALERTNAAAGFPVAPTGDPMADGVGPASWAPRRDMPELDGHGHVKIFPMRSDENFLVSAGRDPRGMPVVSRDMAVVGHVTDIWIDRAEHVARYIEFELEPEFGTGRRLCQINAAKIEPRWVRIRSLGSSRFGGVPQSASPEQVTMLEEEKIAAWYAGGAMYS